MASPPSGTAPPSDDVFTIDCDECQLRDTDACQDCLVSFLIDRPEGAVVFDLSEERALRSLAGAGLTPQNRFVARTGEGEGGW